MAEVEVSKAVPAPQMPSVEAGPGSVDKNALITRLDTLLEQYLNTLDEYEKLMQQLAKQLSSGFFSLTQANFHNRSGVHFGQDSYDERVQATRKIAVSEDEDRNFHFSTISMLPSPAPKPSEVRQDADDQKQDEAVEEKDPIAQSNKKEPKQKTDPTEPRVVDPIRMFGILVPPALRTAQTSFREAVDGPVVRLAAVTGELRVLEREIGRARKAVRKA